jgi:hypothetical protein
VRCPLRLASWCLGLLLANPGCVTSRLLEGEELRARALRRFDAPVDEVYDAAWLALQRQGFLVTTSYRLAGTFSAEHADGRAYDVDVAAQGEAQRFAAVPRRPVPAATQYAEWDRLEDSMAALLRAWRALPEWRFDARRSVLDVPGFSVSLPREWEQLRLSVDRRRATLQQHRARPAGLNPTLLLEIDRRRPSTGLVEAGQRAVALALTAPTRLTFPDELSGRDDGHGTSATFRVLDGNVAHDVTLHLWAGGDEGWMVRAALACPAGDETCDAEWRRLVDSIVAPAVRRLALD